MLAGCVRLAPLHEPAAVATLPCYLYNSQVQNQCNTLPDCRRCMPNGVHTGYLTMQGLLHLFGLLQLPLCLAALQHTHTSQELLLDIRLLQTLIQPPISVQVDSL